MKLEKTKAYISNPGGTREVEGDLVAGVCVTDEGHGCKTESFIMGSDLTILGNALDGFVAGLYDAIKEVSTMSHQEIREAILSTVVSTLDEVEAENQEQGVQSQEMTDEDVENVIKKIIANHNPY